MEFLSARKMMDANRQGMALFLAATALSFPAPASAQIQTYYRAGVWDAYSGRDDKGHAVCGVGNTNPSDNRRVFIHRDIGSGETVFSVSKPGWAIPDNTRVAVVMQIGLNTPWTEQASGHGQTIEWPLDRTIAQPFDEQFRGASSMTLTFPNGNEPPWTIALAGSSAISDAFGRCVSDLARQVRAEQTAGHMGSSSVPAGATQPFSPPPGQPTVSGPADVTTPTQPAGTQPDGTPAH